MVKAPSLTSSNILESIRTGNFYATTGIILNEYQVNGKKITIESQNGDTIKFIGKNGSVLKTVIGGKASYRIMNRDYYVRARIVNAEGKMAWTQPVFSD